MNKKELLLEKYNVRKENIHKDLMERKMCKICNLR